MVSTHPETDSAENTLPMRSLAKVKRDRILFSCTITKGEGKGKEVLFHVDTGSDFNFAETRLLDLHQAAFEKARRQYLAKKRGRSHFDVGDYVLLDKDRDHKLDITDNDPHSWISSDDNKNVDQVVTYMQAHPHLWT
eukprot:m51a1_g9122 hypothetical protein (137) ;mRNA; r:143666-147204